MKIYMNYGKLSFLHLCVKFIYSAGHTVMNHVRFHTFNHFSQNNETTTEFTKIASKIVSRVNRMSNNLSIDLE